MWMIQKQSIGTYNASIYPAHGGGSRDSRITELVFESPASHPSQANFFRKDVLAPYVVDIILVVGNQSEAFEGNLMIGLECM